MTLLPLFMTFMLCSAPAPDALHNTNFIDFQMGAIC